jgi:hypothetical protein
MDGCILNREINFTEPCQIIKEVIIKKVFEIIIWLVEKI